MAEASYSKQWEYANVQAHNIFFFMVKTLICVVGLEASHVHVTLKSSMQLLQQLYIACMQELEFNNKFTSRFLLVYSY